MRKSHLSRHVPVALARAWYSTLLVDTNPQSHATFWFVDNPSEIHYDLQDIDKHEDPIAKVIRPLGIDGLDLLSATFALTPFELELATFP